MKKVVIELDKCYKCEECKAECSYYYRLRGALDKNLDGYQENNGVRRLLALASQRIVCRRCEEPFCVNSCPQDALVKREDGMIDHYDMRCTSCKSCSIACPFGTIYPEIIQYKTSQCDFCIDRANGKPPLCVTTCPEKALRYEEIEEDASKDIYIIKNRLAVHSVRWEKELRKNDKHYT